MKRSLRRFLLIALAAGSIGVPTAAASCPENLGADWCTSFYRAAHARSAPGPLVASHSGGFDWGDAGIGAAVGGGTLLAGISVVLGSKRLRVPRTT